MPHVYLHVTALHDWRLLMLAVSVCVTASWAACYLYARTPKAPAGRRLLWLSMAAALAGAGFLTTHMVIMLALIGLPAGDATLPVVSSLAISILCAWLAFAIASGHWSNRHPRWAAFGGGLVFGLCETLVHCIGTLASQEAGSLSLQPFYLVLTTLIGTVLSGTALSTLRAGSLWRRQLWAALLLTAGCLGMHWAGMAAIGAPHAGVRLTSAALLEAALAIVAVISAAMVVLLGAASAAINSAGRRRSLEMLVEALDVMPGAMAFWDSEGRIQVWNAQFEMDWKAAGPLAGGRSFEDMIGARIKAGSKPDREEQNKAFLHKSIEHFRAAEGDWEATGPDGRWQRVSHRRTASGGTVSMSVDITAMKQVEAEMARARDEAMAASRAKSDFLANMSHEIRTPMNGVMGMNALMLMSSLTPDQRLYAETIQSSAEALLRILNDVLDMSKLEAGMVELERIAFSPRELSAEVVRLVSSSAEQKSVVLSCEVDSPAAGLFLGDPGRLRQILLNLAANAVKFTDHGSVGIHLSAAPDGMRTRLRIEVRDTGIGLTDEAKAKLFQPFQQADASITRRFGGAGLGLSICRQLLELMGGRIGVEDRPGGGSVFWAELPLEAASPAASALRRAG